MYFASSTIDHIAPKNATSPRVVSSELLAGCVVL
jgi:hypothetical protein